MANALEGKSNGITGIKCYQCIHQQDEPPAICPHAKMMDDGQSRTLEVFLDIFNGWYSVDITPLLNKEGKIIGSVHVARNITRQKNAAEFLHVLEENTLNERKQSEASLQESQDNLNAVFNATDESIVLLNADFSLVSMNDIAVQRMGRSREELIGRKVHDLLSPDVVARRQPYFIHVLETGQHVRFEDERNGRWMVNRVHPMLNAEGEVIRLSIYSRDITCRKTAEAALNESESHYRLLAENNTDVIWVQDMESDAIRFISPSVERLLGYTSAEVIKGSISDSMTGNSLQYLRSVIPGRIERFRAGHNEILIDEIEHVHKNGKIIWVEVRTHLMTNVVNGRIEATGVARDITDRKHVEDRAALLALRNKTLLETASDGIHILNELGQCIEANPAFCRMLGYSGEEMLKLNVNDWDEQWSKEELLAIINKFMKHPAVFETRHRSKNGTFYEVEINAIGVSLEGQNYLFASARDISERKRTEAEIKHKNEELLTLNAEKDKFFSIVAHDLRNPFNTLLGFSQMMEEELPDLTFDEIQKIAVNLRKSVNKLYSLLENLLEWSRMQRGLILFHPTPFILSIGIIESIESVEELADKKKIRISFEIPKNVTVIADKQMFNSYKRHGNRYE